MHFSFVGYLFKCIQEMRCHIILFRTFCSPMSLHILYVVTVFTYVAYTLANLVAGNILFTLTFTFNLIQCRDFLLLL